jgi:putative flippase GtrA
MFRRILANRQLLVFAIVGCVAAVIHLSVVALLVEGLHVRILAANVFGFCVAFLVSFYGHAHWTFPQSAGRRTLARKRFFVVAVTGFIANQSAYASGLDAMGDKGDVWYLPILVAVIFGVAGFTFVLSKVWAFAQSE